MANALGEKDGRQASCSRANRSALGLVCSDLSITAERPAFTLVPCPPQAAGSRRKDMLQCGKGRINGEYRDMLRSGQAAVAFLIIVCVRNRTLVDFSFLSSCMIINHTKPF